MNLNTRFMFIEKHPGYFIAFFLAVFAGIAATTYLSESTRRREARSLRSGVQARTIALGMNEFARQHAGPDGRPQYPAAGSDWVSLLIDGGFVEKQDFVSPCAGADLVSYYYIPPPPSTFDPQSTPLIVENPQLNNNRFATVVFADGGGSRLEGDDLWTLLKGLNTSEGTSLRRVSQ